MKLSAIIAPLLDAKADHEMIRKQILAFEAEQAGALEQRRSADAARQARKREADKSRDVTLRHSDRSLTGGDARVEDKTSNLEIEPQEQEERKKRASALSPEFEEFWTAYPNKVGKPKALTSFVAASKRAAHPAIMAGLRRYVANKPHDRPWLNPTTFLNQDRWEDTPAPMARGSPASAAPSMSQIFQAIGGRLDEKSGPAEDRSGFRAAIPHLRAVGSG